MATASRRTGEKGQRTPRSLDTYQKQDGIKGAAYCSCGAVFHNKRWSRNTSSPEQQGGEKIVCPACRRISDHNPAGILSLSGDYFASHEVEIDHLIQNIAKAGASRNPLGRIIAISKEKDGTSITTTDVKLAQKIGREVFKSHGGELHYIWSHSVSPVRVTWSR